MKKEFLCKDNILTPLLKRTKTLLIKNFKLELIGDNSKIYCPNKLDLKSLTAMIGTGGTLSIIFAVSYEDKILEKLVKVFMSGEKILKEEFEELKESVASEIANTIIGNSLHFFPNKGRGVTITPPITITEAKSISKSKGSKIATCNIVTNFGELTINTIGPRVLFVNKFNFKE